MDQTNEALFKQAINEALTNKFQRMADACDEEIVCSRRHRKAMRAIISGKTPRKPLSTKMIAILVAAAILLASCAIIYRNDIREFFTDLSEYFVKIKFEEGQNFSQNIEDIYEFTYVPKGYTLEKQEINRMRVQYIFTDPDENYIRFIQQSLDSSSFSVDIENGDYTIINIDKYQIYYRQHSPT